MDTPIIINMSFGNALLECVKNNKIIGRKLEQKYIITAQLPAIIGAEHIPDLSSINTAAKNIILATCKRIHFHYQLLKINISTGEAEQFMPTAEDLFALDWRIIDGEILKEIVWRYNK